MFILLVGMSSFPSSVCLERLFFPPFDCLGMLAENQLTRNMKVYFSTPNSIPLSILMLVPRYLYCSIVKLGSVGPPILSFSRLFLFLGPLCFHMNFRISLSISAK